MISLSTHIFPSLSAIVRVAVVCAIALAPPATATSPAAPPPNMVIVGIDGMDPLLLNTFMDRGLMPNFKALAAEGAYMPLGTSVPPQSPVAWSNFITGMDPGGHGIFDFIHRDPSNYQPVFSTALVTEPEKTLALGDWILPLSSGETLLLRRGEAFWQILDRHHVPYTIFRVPANFPPAPSKDRTLSGMGTPDLLGSYGTFSLYTDDDIFASADISGGVVYLVDASSGQISDALRGPENALKRDRPTLTRSFTVDIDPKQDAALIKIQDERMLLQAGEWSDWVRVTFDVIGPLKGLSGICRFYLRSVRPYFHLYVTPINIDPAHPALPISTPGNYAQELDRQIGAFYTQGMPEDTKALEYGALDDAEFVGQTDNVLDERFRMLDATLGDYRSGFLFFYVSTIDQSCHALWRNADQKHPAHTAALKFADRFERLYAEMDSLLGVVRERIPHDATLVVMSDHGFAPYYKKAHLNSWLHQNGYLELVRPGEIGQHALLGNVFWRRTQAYALGINGLYVNKLGREGRGAVAPGAVDALLDEITRGLLAWVDPDNGEHVVTTVYKSSEIYHGDEARNAPDLIVGYNRGYRGSDESALGTLGKQVLTPNLGKWTGDHCMDHKLVPGIVLANRPIGVPDPDLKDLPVTILRLYGIDAPAQMKGRDLFKAPQATEAQ